jgi:hypothetical protein
MSEIKIDEPTSEQQPILLEASALEQTSELGLSSEQKGQVENVVVSQ